jgi:NAD(P)-dependent dehydrogenase (short-subunit alcohol dehydrogenase family)
MHVFALGASRHIGYHASVRFLAKGDTVTIVVRNPSNLESDPALVEHVKSGKARLVKGDATDEESLAKAWAEASSVAPVDLILFTVGECRSCD